MKNWKNKFILLALGQAVSMLTSSILQFAIVWHLTQRTGSPLIVTLSTLAGFLPRAILGLFSGVLIDRFDRKKILMMSDMAIAFAAFLLSAVAFFGEIPLWLIFVVLFIRSIGAAFHAPALNAIVPSIVPKEQLVRCAGITQGFDSISLIVSPALAALLYQFWNLSAIIFLDVIGALVAVSIVSLLQIPSSISVDKTKKLHILQDTKEGLAVIRQERGIAAIFVIGTVYSFIYFPIGSMYPLITMTYFGGSVADSSIVEIAFSVGTLVGSLLLGILGYRAQKVYYIIASIAIYGFGVMLTGLLPPSGLKIFILLSGIMGLTIPFFHGLRTAIIQSKIPAEYLGRVLSLVYSMSLFAGPIGLIFGGSFAEFFGVNNCFLICGILALGLAATLFIMPSVRSIKL